MLFIIISKLCGSVICVYVYLLSCPVTFCFIDSLHISVLMWTGFLTSCFLVFSIVFMTLQRKINVSESESESLEVCYCLDVTEMDEYINVKK